MVKVFRTIRIFKTMFNIITPIAVLVLVCNAGTEAAPRDCTSPDGALYRIMECMALMFPNPNHPMYAPILGGADIDYAKDMCKDDKWMKSVQCLQRFGSECTRSPKVKRLINFYSSKKLEEGLRHFCNHLTEYGRYTECFFDNRDSLVDCYVVAMDRLLKYLRTRGATDNVDKWFEAVCRDLKEVTVCQAREMTLSCGNAAGKFLFDMNIKFRPDSCPSFSINAASKLSVSFIVISVVTFIKLFN